MLSLIFVSTSVIVAWLILKSRLGTVDHFVRAGLALLLPIFVTSWVTLVLAPVLNPSASVRILFGLLVAILIVLRAKFRRPVDLREDSTQAEAIRERVLNALRKDWASLAILAIFVPLFSFLLITHSAPIIQGGWSSAGSSWGDLPLHLSYIHYFERQEQLSLISPLFAQQNTTYPFLFDWYTSILVRFQTSVQFALLLSQLQGLLAILLLACGVVRAVDRRPSMQFLTVWLFLFGGGLGWWYFWGDWQTSGHSLAQFMSDLPWQYTNAPEHSIYFSNVITDMLLPQRGFVIGLSTIFAAVCLTLAFHSSKKRGLLWLSSILIGLLPLFHMHSFLWILGGWLLLTCYYWWKLPKHRSLFPKLWLTTLVLAAPQLWWFSANGVGGHFVHWQVGWMLADKLPQTSISFLWLFLLNFGIAGVVLAVLPFQLKKVFATQPTQAIIFGYSWLVFVVCLLLAFQPWEYDNIKLMMPSFFFLSLAVVQQLVGWWKGRYKWLVMVVVLFLSLSGMLSVTREVFLSDQLVSAQDMAVAQQLRDVLEPSGITLTASTHNHLIPMVVGQPIVMGYRGWLWSHGIDTTETAADVTSIYAGDSDAESLLKKYKIRYVYIGPDERAQYKIIDEYWSQNHTLILTTDTVQVYEVVLKK